MRFTDRQLTTIEAALRFWLSVAEHGSRHPAMYPASQDAFHTYPPLADSEVEDLLKMRGLWHDDVIHSGYVVKDVSAGKKIQERLRHWLKVHKIPPRTKIGQTNLYWLEDLQEGLRQLAGDNNV